MKYLLPLLLLAGCAPSKIDTSGTQSAEGSVYTYVVVRLEFIQELKQLCEEANPQGVESEPEHKKVVANCTLDKLGLANVQTQPIQSFTDTYCAPGADLSGLTPEQLLNVQQACLALGVQ